MTTPDKKIDDGGPAFPSSFVPETGMSMRDWFAGQALAGIYASQWFSDHTKEYHLIKQTGDQAIGAAKCAYAAADAMIAARKGGAA